MSRLGSVVNDIAEPHIARTVGLIPAVWTSVGVCVVAAGCATLLLPLERAARRWGAASLQSSTSGAACTNAMQWDAMRAVTTFKRPLWLIVALVVCVYGVVIPFNSVAVPLICELLLCGGRCCAAGIMNCATACGPHRVCPRCVHAPAVTIACHAALPAVTQVPPKQQRSTRRAT